MACIFRILGKLGRRTGGNVVELDHVGGKLAAQLTGTRHQRLEVIAVLDAGVFRDLLEALAFQADLSRLR
jgi:hypothetical protein